MLDNAYQQDIVTRIMLLYASGVNYNVNSNYTKYFAQLCGQIFVLEYFHHKLGDLVEPPIDGTTNCLVHEANLVF